MVSAFVNYFFLPPSFFGSLYSQKAPNQDFLGQGPARYCQKSIGIGIVNTFWGNVSVSVIQYIFEKVSVSVIQYNYFVSEHPLKFRLSMLRAVRKR